MAMVALGIQRSLTAAPLRRWAIQPTPSIWTTPQQPLARLNNRPQQIETRIVKMNHRPFVCFVTNALLLLSTACGDTNSEANNAGAPPFDGNGGSESSSGGTGTLGAAGQQNGTGGSAGAGTGGANVGGTNTGGTNSGGTHTGGTNSGGSAAGGDSGAAGVGATGAIGGESGSAGTMTTAGTGGTGATSGSGENGASGGSGGNELCPTPLPLGTAQEIMSEQCPDGLGSLPNTTCKVIEINCPGVDSAQVQVRVTQGQNGTPKGTVLLESGSSGKRFYADAPDAVGGADVLAELLTNLLAEGYTLVDRAWLPQTGWFQATQGPQQAACRGATLLHWINDHVHQQGALCATGNSGGSMELSLGLGYYGTDTILDLALPTSGPGAGLEKVCENTTDPDWLTTECAQHLEGPAWQCGSNSHPPCTLAEGIENIIDQAYSGAQVCRAGGDANRDSLINGSADGPSACLTYQHAKVHFLYGLEDCGNGAPTAGLFYARLVTSQGVAAPIDFLPDTPHAVYSAPNGASAIFATLKNGCVKP